MLRSRGVGCVVKLVATSGSAIGAWASSSVLVLVLLSRRIGDAVKVVATQGSAGDESLELAVIM